MCAEVHDRLVNYLNLDTYSAAEICSAAEIKATSLVHLVSKSNLELCSSTKGRGQARQYCLIDGYALTLMDRLTRKAKDYDLAAEVVNDLLYGDIRLAMLDGQLSYRTDAELKEALCGNVYKANEEFYYRNFCEPFYLIGVSGRWTTSKRPLSFVFDSADGAFIFNLTLLFHQFDLTLARLRGFDLGEINARKSALKAMIDGLRSDDTTGGEAPADEN